MKLCPSCGARYEDAAKFCQHDGTLLRPSSGGEEEDPYLGQVLLSQFEVQELIGSGGMGRVYKARQLGFDRPTAVKILHNDLVTNQEMVKRFNREAKIISRLDHPAIIHVYLFGELPDGNLYLAMEFADGRALTKLITEGVVPPTRAVHIAAQILGALEEAHCKGVVHRDLKPDNIMLVQKGADPDFVKVLDFGIAKFLGSRTMLTQQGLVFGSARYISPEAAAGEDVDERADLYAVGVILYHMLAGEPPFDDPSAVTLLMRHVNDPAPDLMDKPGARAVPPPLGAAVMRALEKDPSARYKDAAEMRAALIDAAERSGVPVQAELLAGVHPASSAVPPQPEPPKKEEGQSTANYGTNPMYGGKVGSGGSAGKGSTATVNAPKPLAVAQAERILDAPTDAQTPKALGYAATRQSEVPPTSSRQGGEPSSASVAGDGPTAGAIYSYDDDDDPPRVPRSRAWIVLLLVGLIALFGGVAAAYYALRGDGDAEAAGGSAGPSAPEDPAEPSPGSEATTTPETPPVVAADAGAADEGDAALVAVVPGETPAADGGGVRPRPRGDASAGTRHGGGGGSRATGMPPAASLRVSPRRAPVGSTVRIVAKVSPPAALRNPRFVISKQGGGGEPSWHDAASGGEPGLYFLEHSFSGSGRYQITFVARSAHGELRAFADATITGRRSSGGVGGGDEGVGEGGDDDGAVTNDGRDDDKPPGAEGSGGVEEPWIPPAPTPVPPPSPW